MILLIALLVIVQTQEARLTTNTEETNNYVCKLRQYLNDHHLFYFEGRGIGLKLSSDVKEGDVVLRIPFEMSLDPITHFQLFDALKGISYYSMLRMRILHEKFIASRKSFGTEWIHNLPLKYTTPLIWSDSDFDLFEKVGMFGYTRTYFIRNISADHEIVLQKLKGINDLPRELFSYKYYL